MTGETNETAPVATPGLLTVQVISDLKPWATVDGEVLRPLDLDETVQVPELEAKILAKNRHAVIVGK